MKAISEIYNILVFKTNIKTQEDKEKIAPLLMSMPQIYRWSVDCEDCDCVLRIETEGIAEEQIIETVQQAGFQCEELKD
jgi:hypothetical protein